MIHAIKEGFVTDETLWDQRKDFFLAMKYGTLDDGYDSQPIYEQLYRMGVQSVIAYNKKNKSEPERVIGYLKEYFQLNKAQYRTGKRAKVHFDLVHIIYNAAKFCKFHHFKKTHYENDSNTKKLVNILFSIY